MRAEFDKDEKFAQYNPNVKNIQCQLNAIGNKYYNLMELDNE